MSKTLKAILIVLAVVALIGVGFLISRGTGGGGIERTISFSLTIHASGNFEIAVLPTDLDVAKGTPAIYEFTVTPSGGFDVPVELTLIGLPDGAYTWTANPIQPGAWTTTLTVNTAALQTNSTYLLTVLATDI